MVPKKAQQNSETRQSLDPEPERPRSLSQRLAFASIGHSDLSRSTNKAEQGLLSPNVSWSSYQDSATSQRKASAVFFDQLELQRDRLSSQAHHLQSAIDESLASQARENEARDIQLAIDESLNCQEREINACVEQERTAGAFSDEIASHGWEDNAEDDVLLDLQRSSGEENSNFEFLEMMPGNWTTRPIQQIPMRVVEDTEDNIQLKGEEVIEEATRASSEETDVGSSSKVENGYQDLIGEGTGEPLDEFSLFRASDMAKAQDGIRIFRKFRSIVKDGESIALVEALRLTKSFLATNPLDKIYALVGFVYDGSSLVPHPDYNLSIEQLYWKMTKNYFQTTKCLNMLFVCDRGNNEDVTLRSWSPDWRHIAEGLEADYVFRCGYPTAAKSGTPYFPDVGEQFTSPILRVRGAHCATVGSLSSTYDDMLSAETCKYKMIQPSKISSPGIYSENLFTKYGWVWMSILYVNWTARKAIWFCLRNGFDLIDRSTHNSEFDLDIFRGLGNMNGSKLAYLSNAVLRKRTFDSPQLSRWIEENSPWIINGRTLKQRCTPLHKPYISLLIQILASIAYGTIVPTGFIWSGKLAKELMDPDKSEKYKKYGDPVGLFIIIMALWLVGILISVQLAFVFWPTIWEDTVESHRARHDFLRKFDGNMKKNPMRLIVTSCGRIGLGHRHVRISDEVYFLQGCSEPVILRSYKDGYRVVGRVYMYPTLPRPKSDSAEKWKRFKLY